jgi:hypothetical protein
MSITHLYLPISRTGSRRKEEEEKQNRNAALGVKSFEKGRVVEVWK